MKFPEQVITAFVYDQFDKYKIRTGPKGTEICFCGPFEPDTRFRMGINVHSNLVNDFNTGYGNSFIGFVGEILDLEPAAAQNYIIKTYLNYTAIRDVIKPYRPEIKVIELAEMNEPLGLCSITNKAKYGKLAIKLLFDKNIEPVLVKKFKLKYFEQGQHAARLYIPFYMGNKLVFFQGRDMLGKERWLAENKRYKNYRKYVNPTGIQKNQIVFGYDNIEEAGTVVVVEGPFDAMTVKGGVAIMGNRISRAQAKKIAGKKPAKVVFVPDNDKAGENTLNTNIKIMREVAPDIEVGYYRIESKYKDANEAQLKELDTAQIQRPSRLSKLRKQLMMTKSKSFTMIDNPTYSTLKEKIKRA